MTFRKIFIAVIFLLGIFSFSSCKTTKKKDDVSKIGKMYQNTTSYYNGYFNANEIYQNSIASLDQQHQDNYNKILPIYTYRDVPDAKRVSQDLDKVIEKLGRVINLHRAANWVDDSYLLMGKAQYVKQDFEKAQKVFEYFVDEMNPAFKKTNYKTKKDKSKKKKRRKKKKKKSSKKKKTKRQLIKEEKERKEQEKKDSKKKKKKDNKKEKVAEVTNKTTFHRKGSKEDWETYNEGLLWMARTYIERDKWASAYYLLTRLSTEYQNKTLKREYPKVKAYYYLKQKNYSDAIKPLHDAIVSADKKKEKARLSFILGQVYEKLGNKIDAFEMYSKVGDLNPDYDLEFNAILKILKNSDGSSEESVLKRIKKLLKEEKYAEYRDRIYYTLAQIHFNNNNIPVAIENYNKSLANNTNNNPLKAETYYQLATINFDKQDYIKSKLYYDSTLLVLDKNDEKYTEIDGLAKNLTEISKNLEIIQLQDSLIRISKMSKEDQMALAIEFKKKELEEKKQREENKKMSAKKQNRRNFNEMGSAPPMGISKSSRKNKSSFFAYNEASVTLGKAEFLSKWGSIRLEDDWRRSNKTDGDFEDDEAEDDPEEITMTELEMNSILHGVPRTPDQMALAKSKIVDAKLNLGILYRDKLNNYKKSAAILEDLLDKYPEFDNKCKAMYYLQFSYKDLGKYNEANNLISTMSNSFPDCTYTKILTDPDFVNSKKNKVNKKEQYYTSIFELYKEGKFEESLAKINNADKKFKENKKYAIKLDYLTAKITGKLEGKDKYILALEDFVKKYSKSKEAIHAKESLRFLKGDKDAFSTLIYEEELEKYTYQKDKLHYILVIVHNVNDENLKLIKTSISNYNKKFHNLDRLRMSNIYFDTKGKDQVILLRKFDSADSAMKYYNEVSDASANYIDRKFDFELYAVSQKNYREVIKERSINNYKAFFTKTYLKNSK